MRHGARVERDAYPSLDEALAALKARIDEIRAAGPLEEVSAFRTYGPADRVAGRIELSSGGLLRGREAGIDVMGDGSLVPYRGSAFKRRLAPARDEDALQAVRQALER